MRAVCLVALLGGAAACSSSLTEVAVTNPSPRPLQPRWSGDVEVFIGRRPAAEHVDIALITQPRDAGSYGASAAALVEAIRAEAATLGCDGVVIESTAPLMSACIAFVDAPKARSSALVGGRVAAPTGAGGESPAALVERLFARLDRDGDGRLGSGELPQNAAPLASAIDSNADGWITREELAAYNAR